MITSQCIQRMALSAVLLVLPLVIYCGDIAGIPHQTVGSAEQTSTATSSVSSRASGGTLQNHDTFEGHILADKKNRTSDTVLDANAN